MTNTTTCVRSLWTILLLYVANKYWCQLPEDSEITQKHVGAM